MGNKIEFFCSYIVTLQLYRNGYGLVYSRSSAFFSFGWSDVDVAKKMGICVQSTNRFFIIPWWYIYTVLNNVWNADGFSMDKMEWNDNGFLFLETSEYKKKKKKENGVADMESLWNIKNPLFKSSKWRRCVIYIYWLKTANA